MRKTKKIAAVVLATLMSVGVCAACGDEGQGGSSDTGSSGVQVVTYTVTFDADGGTLSGNASANVEEGKTVTLPSATKEGYHFAGWYVGETLVGGAGESYAPMENVTLKAVWVADVPDYASVNAARAIEYAKLIEKEYWNSDTYLSQLTPGGGRPYLWPYTEQAAMVNGVLLHMDKSDKDYEFFKTYLEELMQGLRHYRVGQVNMGAGESWANEDHYLAKYGEADGTANSYAIYNSGRNDDAAVDNVSAGLGGVFFDDNIWVCKEFYYAYLNLGNVEYLNESINILNWIVGEGYESTTGLQGIYWKWSAKFQFDYKNNNGLSDDLHASLNTCSSAPTAMMLAKMYQLIGEDTNAQKFAGLRDDYLLKAQNIYEFCYSVLRNPDTGCLRDKIFLKEGFQKMTDRNQQIELVDAQELPYNTGTFMTAGAELYNIMSARDDQVGTIMKGIYLERNKQVAYDADRKFANTQVLQGQYSYNKNSWFTSFLLDGFIDLSESVEECSTYIEHMRSALDYAWTHNRAEDGLVCPAWIAGWSEYNDNGINSEGNPRQILLQSANAHCYAMLARYYQNV